MTLLDVRDLHVGLPLPDGREVHAVRGINLALADGDRMGLVGESGCGKTSTLLAIIGLLPPRARVSGRILFDGHDILGEHASRPHRWTDVSIVFQGGLNGLNPVKRAGSQLIEPMELHRTATGSAARRRAQELLERVGLPASAADRYPHQLSGGMRQRVMIAMALACRPRLLLADEPTTALDVIVQSRVLELLRTLAMEDGLALLLVTHDLPVVTETCDRIAVMYGGDIVETGDTAEVTHGPRHPYTRGLLAAVPDLASPTPPATLAGAPPLLDSPIHGCSFRPRCGHALQACSEEHPRLAVVSHDHAVACHAQLGPQSMAQRAAEAVPVKDSRVSASSANGTTDVLDVDGLVVRYPLAPSLTAWLRHRRATVMAAVDGVSVTITAGETLALVGESGSGKTTMAHAILRIVPITAGAIRVHGVNVTHARDRELRPIRRRVQMLYQDPFEALNPRWRVRQLVEEPLLIHHTAHSLVERQELVDQALQRVELTPASRFVDRFPHELSGGQLQRVAIAAALVLEPELLIADEPVSMLDVSTRGGILSLLDDLKREHGLALLMITHDLSTAANFANRIAVLHRGRIVEEGAATDIISLPQHPYTQALLAAVPRVGHETAPPKVTVDQTAPNG